MESPSGLRRGAIGLREVMFQSLSAMAPAGAVGFSLVLGAPYAGGALCLSILLALVPCLSVAVALGQMGRHLPSAGAFFTLPARALHPTVGFLVAWAFIYIAGSAGGALALLIGMQLNGALQPAPGAPATLLWVVAIALPLVAVYVLNVRGIRTSAKAGTLVGLVEMIIICAVALVLLAGAWHAEPLAPFDPGSARAPGFEGLSGIIAGAVYAMLAFSGFESAAPLVEEAKSPRVTMQRAMVLSCLVGAGIYLLMAYAATVAVGPDAFARFAVTDEGSPWVPLATSAWSPFAVLLVIAFVSSLVGNQNAAFNALTRTWYGMGRSRVLPSALARTHPRHGSPHVAAAVQLALSLAVAALALPFGAETVIYVGGTVTTALLVMTYLLVNLSCMVFFLRERRSELRWWLHLGVPFVGIVCLVPVLCTALGVGSSLLPFVTPLTGPAALAPPVLAVWMALGVGVVALLAWRRPADLARGGAVLLGEDAAAPSEGGADR